jgi:hypothetical protein
LAYRGPIVAAFHAAFAAFSSACGICYGKNNFHFQKVFLNMSLKGCVVLYACLGNDFPMPALIRFHHRAADRFPNPIANAWIVQRFFEKAFLLEMKRIEQHTQRALLGVNLISWQHDIASHFHYFGDVRGF